MNRSRLLTPLLLLVFFTLTALSPTVSADPQPAITLDVPAAVKIGDQFELTVTFRNTTGGDLGYGPFIDLWLPRNGADGAAGTDTPDGITFISAEYGGQPVTAIVLTFPAGGCVNHPYLKAEDLAPVQICGITGDQLVVLELPFGSFTPAQPEVPVNVTAQLSNLADLNVPLTIQARGGFRFGETPVDDPCCDLPVVSPEADATVTPTLLDIAKTNDALESEIPAGPNFEQHWTITLDVPNGETITDLTITDFLPPQVTFIDVTAATPALAAPPVITAGSVDFLIATVTGGNGTADVSVEFSFTTGDVLDPLTGTDLQIYNSMAAAGTWQPNDPRDAAAPGNATAFGECTAASCPGGDAPYVLALAAQKSVSVLNNPLQPGSTLEYTVTFQLSDFYAFADVELTDIISDGQHLDPGFAPQLSFTQHTTTQSGAVNPANYDVLEYWTGGTPGTPATPPAVDGDTVLVIRLSDETGEPMLGGCIPPAGTATPDCTAFSAGPTTGTLTYRTVVLDEFVNNFPSGDASIDQGDTLSNQVLVAGQLLNPQTFTPGGYSRVDNGSQAEVQIERGELTKSIFAVNGTPCGACTGVQISAGDTVTYRLRQELLTSDFEDFRLVDYLPLPVFTATEITTFDYTVDAAVPPAGVAKFYVGETLYPLMQTLRPADPDYPTLLVDALNNTVSFDYGPEFDDPQNRPTATDLLFTVTVSSAPFADGLSLTNVLQAREGSTNAGDSATDTIIQLETTAPLLLMTKGVVATSNPAGNFDPVNPGPVTFNPPGSNLPFNGVINSTGLDGLPVDSNISGVGIGDIVTFAIVIENTGSNPTGAFDIQLRDTLAPGYAVPASGLNLQARLGNGVPVDYTPLGDNNTGSDLFDNGIELIDPGVNGACGPYSGSSGLNIVVITYDLEIAALTSEVLTNTAAVVNYSSSEGGTDHTGDQDIRDSAAANLGGGGGGSGGATLTKAVDKPFAQPGERVTWTIDVLNTGGSPLNDVTVVDAVPVEFELLSAVTTQGTVALSGQTYTFSLGTLAPDASVRLTISTRIRADTQPPYELINTAILYAGGLELNRAAASVLSAKTLAATGESPWRNVRAALLVALLTGGLLLVGRAWMLQR